MDGDPSGTGVLEQPVPGFLAGLIGGALVLGLGGRLVMMAIQLAHGFPTEWSLDGSLQVIVPGIAAGPGTGLAYAAVRPRLRSGPVTRGLAFGVANALVWGTVHLVRPAGPVELLGSPILGTVLFTVLMLVFGVSVAGLEARFRTRGPAGASAIWPRILPAVGLAGVALTFWVLWTR